MRLVVPGFLAAVLLLAGCGGGTSVAPRRVGPDRAAELSHYLDRMAPSQRRFGFLLVGVEAAIIGVDAVRPGPRWGQAAAQLAPISTGLSALGGRIDAVDPPRPLAVAHRRLAESTLAFGEYVYNVQQALRIRIPSVLLTTTRADTSPIRLARRAWVRAVQRYCSNLGVAPPEWMVPSPAG